MRTVRCPIAGTEKERYKVTRKKKEDPHVESCICAACEQKGLRAANTRLKETCDRLQKNLTDARDALCALRTSHDEHAKKMEVHIRQLQEVNAQLNAQLRNAGNRADRLRQLLDAHLRITQAQLSVVCLHMDADDLLKG